MRRGSQTRLGLQQLSRTAACKQLSQTGQPQQQHHHHHRYQQQQCLEQRLRQCLVVQLLLRLLLVLCSSTARLLRLPRRPCSNMAPSILPTSLAWNSLKW
jgi:hypothetical protein